MSLADSSGLPICRRKTALVGGDEVMLVDKLAATLLVATCSLREPAEHALKGLLHAEVEVQVWPSLTSCEVFGKAEAAFIQQMRGYAWTAPSCGLS